MKKSDYGKNGETIMKDMDINDDQRNGISFGLTPFLYHGT